MTQPIDPQAAYEQMRARYVEAWAQVQQSQQAMIDNHDDRHRVLPEAAAIVAILEMLDAQARTFSTDLIPYVFGSGAVTIDSGWDWPSGGGAASQMAADLQADLLSATAGVRSSNDRLVRQLLSVRGGLTASQEADLAAAEMRLAGITGVVYRNGARFPLDAYADMAMRTKIGTAFNLGILSAAMNMGVVYVEIFDGPDCGWTTHNDPDLANGSFRTIEDCAAHPLAHPNCQRVPGPRPDIRTRSDAANAVPSVTAAQQAAAAANEAQRVAADSPAARQRRARTVRAQGRRPARQRQVGRASARLRRTQR